MPKDLIIHVIATIELAEGQREEFLRHMLAVVPAVRAEEGCVEYGPTIDVATEIAAQGPPRSNVVTVVEKWESLAALQRHLTSPHMIEYRTKVKDLVRQVTLQVLEPVESV